MGFRERFKEGFREVADALKSFVGIQEDEKFKDAIDGFVSDFENIKELFGEEVLDTKAFKLAMPIVGLIGAATIPWAMSALIAAAAVEGANITVLSLLAAYQGWRTANAVRDAKELVDVSLEIRKERKEKRRQEEKAVAEDLKKIIKESQKDQEFIEKLKEYDPLHPMFGWIYPWYTQNEKRTAVISAGGIWDDVRNEPHQRLDKAWLKSLEDRYLNWEKANNNGSNIPLKEWPPLTPPLPPNFNDEIFWTDKIYPDNTSPWLGQLPSPPPPPPLSPRSKRKQEDILQPKRRPRTDRGCSLQR